MNIVAIIQARTGSTRLPRKVLRLLANKTVLAHVIERAKAIKGVAQVVVATTTDGNDDLIVDEAVRNGAEVFRGSENDVLDRYFTAASHAGADVIIRITSDCPLLDPDLVSAMLERFLVAAASGRGIDYMSNGLRRTFPRGLDAEIFTWEALSKAHHGAKQGFEREHVTPYIYQHPGEFRLHSYEGEVDLSGYRWTLDTEADMAMLTKVFDGLGSACTFPKTADVLAFLASHPEVARINATVRQKALGE